jgi:hypothetical protein
MEWFANFSHRAPKERTQKICDDLDLHTYKTGFNIVKIPQEIRGYKRNKDLQ